MANTLNSNLIVKHLADAAVRPLEAALPMLPYISTLTDGGEAGRGRGVSKLVFPRVISLPAAAENLTNFQSTGGDANVTGDEIACPHLVVRAHMSSADIQNGADLAWLVPGLAGVLGKAIFAKYLAQVSTSNYGAAVLTIAPGSFGGSEAATLADNLRASGRSLCLDTKSFGGLAPSLSFGNGTWRYPGFDSVSELTDLTGIGAGLIGFAGTPACMSGIVAIPATPWAVGQAGRAAQFSNVSLPSLGVSVLATVWPDVSTRSMWASLEAVVNFAPADSGALKLVAAAT